MSHEASGYTGSTEEENNYALSNYPPVPPMRAIQGKGEMVGNTMVYPMLPTPQGSEEEEYSPKGDANEALTISHDGGGEDDVPRLRDHLEPQASPLVGRDGKLGGLAPSHVLDLDEERRILVEALSDAQHRAVNMKDFAMAGRLQDEILRQEACIRQGGVGDSHDVVSKPEYPSSAQHVTRFGSGEPYTQQPKMAIEGERTESADLQPPGAADNEETPFLNESDAPSSIAADNFRTDEFPPRRPSATREGEGAVARTTGMSAAAGQTGAISTEVQPSTSIVAQPGDRTRTFGDPDFSASYGGGDVGPDRNDDHPPGGQAATSQTLRQRRSATDAIIAPANLNDIESGVPEGQPDHAARGEQPIYTEKQLFHVIFVLLGAMFLTAIFVFLIVKFG